MTARSEPAGSPALILNYRHLAADEPIDPACRAAAQNAWNRRKKHHQNTKGRHA